jgi:ribosomal protein S18 acetylase RimI-like enzyme
MTRRSGVVMITSPVAYSVFNIALMEAAAPEVEGELTRRIRVARQHYEALGYPWSFWICESDLGRREMRRLFETFTSEGMNCIAESPGMDTGELSEERRRLPALTFRQVEDEAEREDFSMLVCASFHIPPLMAAAVYAKPQFWAGRLKAWVGYHGGRPVTTAATVASGGVLGLYSVATLPEYRRMGFGEMAVRHVVARSREEGAQGPVVLQSSTGAYALYKDLGFRRRTRFFIFATPERAG